MSYCLFFWSNMSYCLLKCQIRKYIENGKFHLGPLISPILDQSTMFGFRELMTDFSRDQ